MVNSVRTPGESGSRTTAPIAFETVHAQDVMFAATVPVRLDAGHNLDLGTLDDPYYWFPVYAAVFYVRAGLLEGPAIMLLVFFLLTVNWVLLSGVAVLAAALIAQMPTRSKYDAWLEDVRQRQAGGSP